MTRKRDISGVYVTEDMVREAIDKRYPGIGDRVTQDEILQLADRASKMIAGGYDDALDQVVVKWATEKVNDVR